MNQKHFNTPFLFILQKRKNSLIKNFSIIIFQKIGEKNIFIL